VSQLFQILRARRRAQPGEPIVTWYGAGGARMELSVVTFSTAVAKTAGLLIDELDAEEGDTITIDLPLHWQLPVWLAAADVAGLSIGIAGPDGADSGRFSVHADADAALSSRAATRIVTSTTPFGLPGPPLPAQLVDHAREALGQPDDFTGVPQAGRLRLGGTVVPSRELGDLAVDAARRWAMASGGRLLCALAVNDPACALAVWVAPLVLAGSVVLVAEGDPGRIAAAESTTATTGPTAR
jgi:uncharacterized protein (TIGR03089 family)